VTRWIVRPPARSPARVQPYRALDIGDDVRVTRLAGARRPAALRLAASLVVCLAVGACLGPTSSTFEPTLEPSGGVTASVAASPSRLPTAAPTATPAVQPQVATKPAPCPGSDKTPNAPAGRQLSGTSSNWSGYVAARSKGGVTCLEASWVEPDVTCARTGHQAVAIWIGVDGFSAKALGVPSTNALVQIGTQADCNNGVASHGAWHEILPAESTEQAIPGAVNAGDHISARISYGNGAFTLVLYDAETKLSFSLVAGAPGAPRRSAEWIVEAPATSCPDHCSPVPLPDFDSVTFAGAYATIAGQRGSISNDGWAHVKLQMVRSGIARTAITPLYVHGTVFKVTWLHR
jgi:hypothetical protein